MVASDDQLLHEVDAIFERFFDAEKVPGIAYGVVIDGELAHSGGLGVTRVTEAAARDSTGSRSTPALDADSVFRIASMTKSFTAAATLLLRDDGALRLDDPVGDFVPELAGFKGPTTDSPVVTVRHLMTMSSGLPTDDPWGDRLQGMPLEDFSELLTRGFGFVWAPDTNFEYSNLGFGILGRILSNISGVGYADLMRRRVLDPLGMTATAYEASDTPDDRLVRGYVSRDGVFVEQPFDRYGALAPMGGLFSTVRDLAMWVSGFADAFPPRDGPEGEHPLSRASRREMQQAHRAFEPELRPLTDELVPGLEAGGYGFGLFVRHDLRLGHVVSHSGGYPGFGSHMRWHPASGIGVIALGNCSYVPVSRPATSALESLVTGRAAPIRAVVPWDATVAAQAKVERLIAGWNDDLASGLLAINVDQDEPLGHRRGTFDEIRRTHGRLVRDGSAEFRYESPAHLIWWMRGERAGRVRIEIVLSPERPPRVQTLEVRSVPDPPASVRDLADRVVVLLGRGASSWPDDLVPAGATEEERATGDRMLRASGAMAAACTLGDAVAGDGETTATFPLHGERVDLALTVSLDAGSGGVSALQLLPDPMVPPADA
jgi:CubicO group peptidase (beta-lactamase class C family)